MPSLDDSKEAMIQQLQEEAVRLLDKAQHGPYLQRALSIAKATQLVREMNRLDPDKSESPRLRTREEAFRDLAKGRLK